MEYIKHFSVVILMSVMYSGIWNEWNCESSQHEKLNIVSWGQSHQQCLLPQSHCLSRNTTALGNFIGVSDFVIRIFKQAQSRKTDSIICWKLGLWRLYCWNLVVHWLLINSSNKWKWIALIQIYLELNSNKNLFYSGIFCVSWQSQQFSKNFLLVSDFAFWIMTNIILNPHLMFHTKVNSCSSSLKFS